MGLGLAVTVVSTQAVINTHPDDRGDHPAPTAPSYCRSRCSRSASSSAAKVSIPTLPTGSGSRRRTDTERTCSACAFDARAKPDSSDSTITLKRKHVRGIGSQRNHGDHAPAEIFYSSVGPVVAHHHRRSSFRRFTALRRIEIHPVNVRAANHSVSAVTASHTSSTSPSANAAA